MLNANASKKTHIAITADIVNGFIQPPFEHDLRLEIAHTGSQMHVTSDPIYCALNTKDGIRQMAAKMHNGYDVIITMLGVPNTFSYVESIDNMLSCWAENPYSVLLVASPMPRTTQRIINSWHGWGMLATSSKIDIKTLKKSVIVNKRYLLAQKRPAIMKYVLEAASTAAIHQANMILSAQITKPVAKVHKAEIHTANLLAHTE